MCGQSGICLYVVERLSGTCGHVITAKAMRICQFSQILLCNMQTADEMDITVQLYLLHIWMLYRNFFY
jgi:hypothetical protein